MDAKTLDKITDTKEDFEFCVVAGREPNQYTAGVKVWEYAPDDYYIRGYYDMPHSIEDLGTPVFIHDLPTKPGSLPPQVMVEVQKLLNHGIQIMIENGIRVSRKRCKEVYDMCDMKGLK